MSRPGRRLGPIANLYKKARDLDARLMEEPPEVLPPDWYADFTEGSSFVISGLLEHSPVETARSPGELARVQKSVADAYDWCVRQYGRVIGGKKNLIQGSGRWAFRVPKPAATAQPQEEK